MTAPDAVTPRAAPERAQAFADAGRRRLRELPARLFVGRPIAPTPEEWAAVEGALWQGDAPMDALVAWMFEGRPGAAKAQFEQALTRGIDTLTDPPEPLRAFFARVDTPPAWLDPELLAHGSRFLQSCGVVIFYVLRDLALLGGYAAHNSMNQTLAISGTLEKDVSRRLGETGKWLEDVTRPGGVERFGEGFLNTMRVRLVHGLVRRAAQRREGWDPQRWGLPINQVDMLATYLAFGPMTLIGARLFGVPVTPRDSRAAMHLWRYVGWLSGVDEAWLALTERDGVRKLLHAARTHRLPDDKIHLLGSALIREPLARAVPGLESSPRLRALARWYLYHKHLSNASLVLGWRARRRLGVPFFALPWYPLLTAPVRFVVYGVHRLFGARGLEALRRRGVERQQRLLQSYFGGQPAAIIDPKRDHPAHVA